LLDPLGRIHSTPPERAALLRRTHLPTDRSSEDIDPTPSVTATPTPPWTPITDLEVERAVLYSRNTAPGSDEISPAALKLAWSDLGSVIARLYRRCLTVGW